MSPKKASQEGSAKVTVRQTGSPIRRKADQGGALVRLAADRTAGLAYGDGFGFGLGHR